MRMAITLKNRNFYMRDESTVDLNIDEMTPVDILGKPDKQRYVGLKESTVVAPPGPNMNDIYNKFTTRLKKSGDSS